MGTTRQHAGQHSGPTADSNQTDQEAPGPASIEAEGQMSPLQAHFGGSAGYRTFEINVSNTSDSSGVPLPATNAPWLQCWPSSIVAASSSAQV